MTIWLTPIASEHRSHAAHHVQIEFETHDEKEQRQAHLRKHVDLVNRSDQFQSGWADKYADGDKPIMGAVASATPGLPPWRQSAGALPSRRIRRSCELSVWSPFEPLRLHCNSNLQGSKAQKTFSRLSKLLNACGALKRMKGQ